MTFSNRLEQALKIRGLAAGRLAKEVGVAPSAVSGWLSGGRPSRKNVEQVAAALDVSVGWLELGEGVAPVDLAALKAEIQRLIWWFRPQSPDGQRVMGEAATTSFDPSIAIVTREGGQNIRDARRKGEQTVRANFVLERLRGEPLKRFLSALRFDELRPHLDGAAEGKSKQAAVIRHGLRAIDSDELLLMRIEDVDGVGLLGAEFGDSSYSALVRNVMHTNKGGDAGGSHGLGKSTIQRASSIGVVLFNSNLSEPEPGTDERNGRLVGRASLPWHERADGAEFAGPAWFGVAEASREGTARSLYASHALQRELRIDRPEATGTTVLVVGVHDPSGVHTDPVEMAREISRTLAQNFFAALVEQGEAPPIMKATVRVVDVGADGAEKSLHEEIIDPVTEMAPLVDLLEKWRSLQTVDELQASGDVLATRIPLVVPRRMEDPAHASVKHEAILLVRLASVEESGHPFLNSIVLMRGALMRVEAQKPRGLGAGARSFFAVVLAGEAAGGEAQDKQAELFLKSAEPPSHEAWKLTPELASSYQGNLRKCLEDFRQCILEKLSDAVTVPLREPSDGPQSLRELLRVKLPPEPTHRPRIVAPVIGRPTAEGAWEVLEATVQLPPKSKSWTFDPVLRFGAETGGGVTVRWASVEAVSGCSIVDGYRLRVDAGVRKAKWKGLTDPASHPAAATDAVAVVDIQRVVEEDA